MIPIGNGISNFRTSSQNGLYLLSIASALVLLIACANLANLSLVRNIARRQQIALRLSLETTRSRLIRAALTESILLSLLGGTAGALLAFTGAKAILQIAFRGAHYVPISATPSLPVLVFVLLLSIATGIVFGVAPAWLSTKADLADGLRAGTRTNTGHSSSLQKTLVIVQAALSVILLVVAGLVTQSLRNLETVNLGFQTQGRILAHLNFKAAGYQPEQLPALYQQIQQRLESIPGVRSASLSLYSPQENCCMNMGILLGGRNESWIPDVNVLLVRVSTRYFETIGTPRLLGRAFTDSDTPTSQHVAVVDQSFARKFFPGESPIGKHFGLSLPGEIGVRMALGATRSNVVGMVLRSAFAQIAIGLAIGIPLTILCGLYLAHQLYEVSRFNPIAIGGAIVTLSLCAFIAGLIPARRAASIEPMEASPHRIIRLCVALFSSLSSPTNLPWRTRVVPAGCRVLHSWRSFIAT